MSSGHANTILGLVEHRAAGRGLPLRLDHDEDRACGRP